MDTGKDGAKKVSRHDKFHKLTMHNGSVSNLDVEKVKKDLASKAEGARTRDRMMKSLGFCK